MTILTVTTDWIATLVGIAGFLVAVIGVLPYFKKLKKDRRHSAESKNILEVKERQISVIPNLEVYGSLIDSNGKIICNRHYLIGQ